MPDETLALDAAGSFGFALAGGYAVQAHGFLNRMSADVDLFAEASTESDIAQAVEVVIAASQRKGLQVETEVRGVSVDNKVCALFGRAEVRVCIDVDAILTSGRYAEVELLDLAADHDPGFDQSRFAEALAAIDRPGNGPPPKS